MTRIIRCGYVGLLVLSLAQSVVAQGTTGGPAILFADCGVLGPGPQGCTLLHTDEGSSFAVENTGAFGFGDRVWVEGQLVQQSNLCFPVIIPAIINNRIGECFEDCGVLQPGPQGCPIIVLDNNEFLFVENTGGFGFGETVWVQGCRNEQSQICPPLTAPGIEDNRIGRCFEGCGRLIQGIECVLFVADAGGVYQLEFLDGFGPGDRVEVRGCLNPSCVSFCFPPDGCIEDNTIRPCLDCVPSPDGLSCTPGPCGAIPEAVCTPVCATLNLATGAIAVTECACLTPDQCHVDIAVATFPRCVGGCPPGTFCLERRTFVSDDTVEICCECRPCLCPGDMNGDGILDGRDIQEFIRCLFAVVTPGNPCACADIDGDGSATLQDIPLFIALMLDKVPCPPRGACCLDIDDGPLAFDTCIVTTPATCQQLGGFYQGDDTTCEIRGCCLPNGFCQDADVNCCLASGGVPQNGPCSATTCPPIGGACCFDATGDGIPESCAVLPASDCQTIGGSFEGPGTQCQGTGACCFGITGGSCAVMDRICCDNILGVFQGFGTVCSGDANGNGLDDTCE